MKSKRRENVKPNQNLNNNSNQSGCDMIVIKPSC